MDVCDGRSEQPISTVASEAEAVAREARLLADLLGDRDSILSCTDNRDLGRIRVLVEFHSLRSDAKTRACFQDIEDGERQLESGPVSPDPIVLSDSSDVLGGSPRNSGDEAPKERANTERSGRGGGDTPTGESTIVSTQVINPNKFRKMLYDTPKSRRVELDVEASSAVDVFVVQKSDLDQWRKRQDYGGMGFFRQKKLKQPIKLERGFGDWYLIIENRSDVPVAVHYEVYDL